MNLRLVLLFLFLAPFSLGQGLPDRDALIEKFVVADTNVDAAAELLKHFQMGGLRTIIRNLEKLPPDIRLRYYHVLLHMDLMRFRNDLNANVEEFVDPDSRAMSLMLLATIARNLQPSVFSKYADDPAQPIKVRLAAASGLVKIQKPAYYQKFHELAEEAVYEPSVGKNDFAFAHIGKSANNSFYLYTRGQLSIDKPSDGVIKSAILMSENESTDVYETVLDLRKRKWVPMMIDRAVQVGGVDLLKLMVDHRLTRRRFVVEVSSAMTAAEAIAPFRSRMMDKSDQSKTPIGAVVPFSASGSGSAEGYHAGYGIIKVAADGTMSLVQGHTPFGGSNNMAEVVSGKTLPAYLDWEPVESYYLILAP